AVRVPTIHGFANLKIPSGTENGKVFRLRGKGIVNPRNHAKGDHHVRMMVEVPVHLNGAQKKKLQELAGALDAGHYPQNVEFYKQADKFYERKGGNAQAEV
ncbi:MAG: DnaJ C-terminal domain-containing protein, partial [Kiritimatiellae bacterium]|nr:DnaJ C-terminal domain-containing protein [Kiritimatiellia bacterium]